MTFAQELTLTIVDKLLIALVVAGAAFLLNRSLERFKSSQALHTEFAKQRLARIAEIWQTIYEWESDTRKHAGTVHKAIAFDARSDRDISAVVEPYVGTMVELRDTRSRAVLELIERNRFWLDEELFAKLRRHYDEIHGYLATLAERIQSAPLDEFERRVSASRQSIFSFLKSS